MRSAAISRGDRCEHGSDMEMSVPSSLEWLREEPGGSAWLTELPSLVDECARKWKLQLGDPFRGEVSYVAPATTPAGSEVVLKVSFPSWESEHEAAALKHWAGHGAVRLLDHDADRDALLLERCMPGDALSDHPEEEATDIVAGVLRGLWEKTAPEEPFVALASAADRWAARLQSTYERAAEPFDRSLLDSALSFMATVPSRDANDVVLHQDLHGGNVLRRGSEWVAIDPKPLVGERAFDLASHVRDRRHVMGEDARSRANVQRRLDELCSTLDIDHDRARGWAVAHALAWSITPEGSFYPDLILAARLIAGC